MKQKILKGGRLECPEECKHIAGGRTVYDKIMLPCWASVASARPSFTSVAESLETLLLVGIHDELHDFYSGCKNLETLATDNSGDSDDSDDSGDFEHSDLICLTFVGSEHFYGEFVLLFHPVTDPLQLMWHAYYHEIVPMYVRAQASPGVEECAGRRSPWYKTDAHKPFGVFLRPIGCGISSAVLGEIQPAAHVFFAWQHVFRR